MRRFWHRLAGDPWLPVLAALAVAGVVVAVVLHRQAFAVVSVEFRLLAPDAQRAAAAFLRERGVDPDRYIQTVSFAIDESARNYIERTAGLETLNQAGRERSIWFWTVRFFRPLEREEYRVRVDPRGPIVGASHDVPEAMPGLELPSAQAEAIARDEAARLGYRVDTWTLVATSSDRRPSRLDHSFTWEEPDFAIGEARYRLTATVHGDRPGRVSAFFKIPEEWQLAQSREYNRGVVLVAVGWTITGLMLTVAALLFVQGVQAGRLRWRFTLTALAFLTGVGLLAAINGIPLALSSFPTTQSVPAWLASLVISAMTTALPIAAGVLVSGAVGGWLLGRARPGLQDPEGYATLRGLASPTTVRAVLVGYLLSGIWLGYITLVYAAGSAWFGFWSPPEVPYRDVMSTWLPVAFPVTVGAAAAIGEEFVFRLLGVPLVLLGVLRLAGGAAWGRTLALGVAVVGPALVWGSLHATWPQQPFWIRAVEIGGAGIVSAVILLRYGILATLVNHYVSNAAVVGALFLLSGNQALQLPAFIALALPLLLLVPWLGASLPGRPKPNVALEPAAVQRPAPLADADDPRPHLAPPSRRPTWSVLWLLAAGFAAAALVVGCGGDPTPLTVRIDAAEAQRIAREIALSQGVDPRRFRHVVTFLDRSRSEETVYLLRHLGADRTARLHASLLVPWNWQVRFFRPSEKESVWVWLAPDGRPAAYFVALEEAAPGGRLAPAQAQLRAEQDLGELAGRPASAYRLIDTGSEERPNRTDYRFTWERLGPDLGEARLRTSVRVFGAALGEYFPFLKIPEEFLRARAETTPAELVWTLTRAIAAAGLVLLGAIVLFRALLERRIRLRLPIAVAAVWAGASLVRSLLGWPEIVAGYNSTMDLAGYLVWRYAGIVQGVLLGGLQLAAVTALAAVLWRHVKGTALEAAVAVGARRPDRWLGVAALLPIPVLAFVDRLADLARDAFARDGLEPTVQHGVASLGAVAPALHVIAGALADAVWWTALGLTAALLILRLCGPHRRLAAALIGLGATGALVDRFETPAQLAVDIAAALVLVILGWLVVRTLIGTSPLALAYALFVVTMAANAVFFLTQSTRATLETGLLLTAILVAPAAAGAVAPGLRAWLGARLPGRLGSAPSA